MLKQLHNKIFLLIPILLLGFSSCKEKPQNEVVQIENHAIQDLTQLIKEDPGNSDLFYERAQLYFQEKAF